MSWALADSAAAQKATRPAKMAFVKRRFARRTNGDAFKVPSKPEHIVT
jgi:hypothetical protein